MNEKIMKDAGFGREVELVKQGRCPLCKAWIDINEFRDRLSIQEFNISGMCQVCQDKVFNSKDDIEY